MNHHPQLPWPSHLIDADDNLIMSTALNALEKTATWRAPITWSQDEWRMEMEQTAMEAAFQARREYDSSDSVPLPEFIGKRVLVRVLKYFRREWRQARRRLMRQGKEGDADSNQLSGIPSTDPLPDELAAHGELRWAVSTLSPEDAALIETSFWEQLSDRETAKRAGVNQSTITRRKRSILRKLRNLL